VPNCGLESSTTGIAITLHSAKTENVLEYRMFSAVDDRTRTVITVHTKHQRDTGEINKSSYVAQLFYKTRTETERKKWALIGKGKDRYWIFYRHQIIWNNAC